MTPWKHAAFGLAATLVVFGVSLSPGPVADEAPQPVTLGQLDTWLFAGPEEFYRVGDRVLRYEAAEDLKVVFSSALAEDPLSTPGAPVQVETLRALLDRIDAALPGVGISSPKVRGLLEDAQAPRGDIDVVLVPPSLAVLGTRPQAGYEAVAEAARDLGCIAYQAVPYAERHPTAEQRRWRLVGATVRISAELPAARFEDCLFRALLIALGLHHTERLAFDPTPLRAAERVEALRVLSLVYRPEVESGMTRTDLLATLRAEGLVAD
jgi:hypothetical protein